ncbi:HYR domain-containing protein [Marixanthomonas ophiurae]|uniref:HYR domain-containing protein n=1 Tax=Marixanthomonas ophiurae TaxID=387659 RepID=A0A3E1Q673_9FLAO|nr:HYR domain-containing protein [Marixanthomonas ophiurae]RFN57619.1 HYR domain-containing protein [Marixanthomonas ophiurae]
MRKNTLITFLCVLCTISFALGQSFSPTSSNQTNIIGNPAGSVTINNGNVDQNRAPVAITHSASQTIEAGITCNSGGIALNTNLAREFDLENDFGIDDDFQVTNVEFAIFPSSNTATTFPVTVNLYSSSPAFPGGTLSLLSSTVYDFTTADAGTIVSVPISATVPQGSLLVYEISVLGDGATVFFIGTNDDGQTDPSYIQAADCGVPSYVDLATVGSGQMYIMNIVGHRVIPPIIVCPSDLMVDTDPSDCGAIVNFADAIAIDPEGDPVTVSQTMGPVSGSMFPTGDTVVEFTATDIDGETSTCQFTVTVTDMEVPEAICQNLTLDLMGGSSVSITPADIDNGSTDNCGIVDYSLDIDTFTCADVGDNTVTLTVTDDEGNSSTCTATVTIEDNTAPEITCIGEPGIFNILEEFEAATIPSGWTTIVESGADDWAFGSGDMPGSTDDFPTNAAIFDDDAAGSGQVNLVRLLSPVYDISAAASADLNFDYSLQDFVGDGEISVEVWDGSAWQEILFATEDTPPTSLGVTDMMPFANPDFQVRFTYDDNGGFGWGAGVDNFALNYELSTSPPLEVALDASGNATIPASDLIQTVNEACGYVVTVGGPATGGGSTTETLETTFAGGNGLDGAMFDIVAINEVTINSFDVNLDTGITDDVEVYYKSGTWVGFEEDAGAWTLLGTANVTSAGDGLPTPLNLSLGQTIAAGDTGAFYVTTTSGGMNYTDGTTTGAVFASDDNIEFLEGAGKSYPFGVSTFDPRVFNGNIIYDVGPQIDSDVSFDCSMLGENEVEVFVTDDSGNFSSCTATVNVVDITAPIIICAGNPGPVSILEEFEGATIPDGWSTTIDAGVQDWTFGSGEMPFGPSFPTNAAIFDDDAAGNGEINLATLYSPVYDITGSNTASISFDYVMQDFIGDGIFTVEVYDGADWQEILFVDASTNIENTGMIDMLPYLNEAFQVRFTYDDEGSWAWGAGIDNFQLDYEVTDITAIDIPLGPDGTATIDPNSLIQSVDEACGISTVASDITEVSCADIGTPMTITIFASDASGNIASCTAEINVVDTLAPEVTCPEDQSVDPGTGNLFYEVPDYFASGEGSALDNCTDPVTITSQNPAPGELLSDGVYTVTLTAEDEYGNVGTCTFELTVESILGVDDNSLSNSISMYPNPADSQVTISNKSDVALQNAVIYDINGKLINQYDLSNMQGKQVIDVSALATGVYVVQITGETSSVSKRLIIK